MKYGAFAIAFLLGLSSCEDFLDRPAESNYNVDVFYKNNEQCLQGVNYLYNSPWYDFQRGFIKVGEVMSGNMYYGDGAQGYTNFVVNGTDQDLINMSYSLWAVNAHCNTVIKNLQNSTASASIRNQCIGEALTWKAMAYFFMARTFGDVPIVHDNNALLTSGNYNSIRKVTRGNVYEYIVLTLEKAMELLPKKTSSFDGRIDYYAAEALLAKVYLAKSGETGTRSAEELAKSAEYAKDVIDNSGRHLLENYSDVFRLKNNVNEECLISWAWSCGRDPWTQQNTLQSDLAYVGFDENGDCWGGWVGPSVDLQEAFGASAKDNPATRTDTDTRRKATMMFPGDVYEYFWTDKGGFDFLRFLYDSEEYGKGGPAQMQCPTGAACVKHLYGDNYDHEQALGSSPANMANGLFTHLLRLSDVYLIYAEAKMGLATSTTDASALAAFNAVRNRAIPTATPKTQITWDDVWKERRLELACEGDRWYDYVRRSYYDMSGAISELKAQHRNAYTGMGDAPDKNIWGPCKAYYNGGEWDNSNVAYDTNTPIPNVTESVFKLPFPTEDVTFNPLLLEDAIEIDVRAEYSYNF